MLSLSVVSTANAANGKRYAAAPIKNFFIETLNKVSNNDPLYCLLMTVIVAHFPFCARGVWIAGTGTRH